MVTDVADTNAMRHLADVVVKHFVRINMWINDIGIGAVGAFDATLMAAHRRVIETNLFVSSQGHAIDGGGGHTRPLHPLMRALLGAAELGVLWAIRSRRNGRNVSSRVEKCPLKSGH